MPYFYALLALPLVLAHGKTMVSRPQRLVLCAFAVILIVKLSLFLPWDAERIGPKETPLGKEFSTLVKYMTDHDDKIIVYTFMPIYYILTDRLPASGHLFYFPWQEKYNENPKFGIGMDACQQIAAYRPKIMMIDKWKVWDRYTWESYAGCVQRLLDEEYVQWPNRPYYLRKDMAEILAHDLDGIRPAATDRPRELRPSPQLSARRETAIPLHLLPAAGKEGRQLKRIGLRFGTYERRNRGEAELTLRRADDSVYVQRFFLSDLSDNGYKFFDIEPGQFVGGEIAARSGGGVSTWESHDEEGGALTCAIYVYTNDARESTPGCPGMTELLSLDHARATRPAN
jgi:hypothetical protein